MAQKDDRARTEWEAAGRRQEAWNKSLLSWGGRGDPKQGDVYNDRRAPGGTQPRREEPRPT
jgi:hypothetical protein